MLMLKFYPTDARVVPIGRSETRLHQRMSNGKPAIIVKSTIKASTAALKSVGAVRFFERSDETRSLRFAKYLGDGNSSLFRKVEESRPYGDIIIQKLDCVGHVQKRCDPRLWCKGLTGAWRLTDKWIDTLQNYYGLAIRQNTGNLTKMKGAVSEKLHTLHRQPQI